MLLCYNCLVFHYFGITKHAQNFTNMCYMNWKSIVVDIYKAGRYLIIGNKGQAIPISLYV